MTDGSIDWLRPLRITLQPWMVAATDLPWLAVIGQWCVAFLLAALLHRLLTPVLLRLTRPFPFLRRLVAYGHRIVGLVLALYLVQFSLEHADPGLPAMAMVRHLGALVLAVALSWLGVRCVQAVADTIIELHPVTDGADMQARRIQTQTRVLSHCVSALVILVGLGVAFSTLPLMRQIGATLLASAGVAGLIVGFAAKPVLGNLLAGMQLALTQPISLGDVVIVEQEWGWIDEITGTYVVIRIWDDRRMVVPLQWFIEHPFQNWTRNQTAILGTVLLWVDYRMPVAPLREEASRLCTAAPEWDGRLCTTHLVELGERAMQLRILVSAADAGKCWDLRALLREGLVAFMQANYPAYLPRQRVEIEPSQTGEHQV